MKRSTAAALFALWFLAVVLSLVPLLRSMYWGSDFGEYLLLTRAFAANGALPSSYVGWGATYPSFPGMFVVNGAFVLAGGTPDEAAVFVVPVIAAFGVLPMFLIAARVTGDDLAGLVAAGFLGVSFLHVFPMSHAVPASLGDFLLLGALAMFLGLRHTPKLFAPLVLTGLAVVVTHHLATYALLLTTLAALLLRAILDRKLTLRAVRLELAFFAILVAATLAYWSLYAIPFWTLIVTTAPSFPILFAGAALAVAAVPIVIRLRRRSSWRFRPHLRTIPGAGIASGVALATCVGIVSFASLAPVPGTSIRVELPYMIPFVPLFAFLALAAAGRKVLDFSREGVAVTAWFLAIILSIVVGALAAPNVLIPYRHLEYAAIPLAVMMGAGFRWLTLGVNGGRRGAAVGAAAVLLVAGTAASAYPPPAALAGFNEGIASKTVETTLWVRAHIHGALVAGDHRESTMLFGIGGVDATWDRELRFWHTSSLAEALAAMNSVRLDSRTARVDWVMIDADLRAGLQGTPFAPATPLLPSEEAKFTTTPFQKVFDSGFAQIYYVNWGLVP